MAQLTLYLDDATQRRLREVAAARKVSQSQFVAELIRSATANEWPAQALALLGSVPDFPRADELRRNVPDDAPRGPW